MNEKLKEITSTHASVSGGHAYRSTKAERSSAGEESLDKRFAIVESRLVSIAEAVGVSNEADVGDDDADRKRLKERLKEALEVEENKRSLNFNEKESWMEYIFGICKPDGRIGKRGSRWSHA